MEDVLVALIIQLCKHDTREYKVQDEYVSCNEYMVNCSVDSQSNFTKQTVDRCNNDNREAAMIAIVLAVFKVVEIGEF